MALPGYVDFREVRSQFRDITGAPFPVSVTFRPESTRGGGGVTIYKVTRAASNVDEDGEIHPDGLVTITLACGDDTDLTPLTGYHVVITPLNDVTAAPEEFDIMVPIEAGPLELDEARELVYVPPPEGYVPRREDLVLAGLKELAFSGSYLDLLDVPVNAGWQRFYDQSVEGGWDLRGDLDGPRSWRSLIVPNAPIPTEMQPGDDLLRLVSDTDPDAPLIVVLDVMRLDATLQRVQTSGTGARAASVRTVTGSTFVEAADDYIRVDSADDAVVNVLPTDLVNVPIGQPVLVRQVSAGEVLLVPDESVIINGFLWTAGPGTTIWLMRVTTSMWEADGGVAGPEQTREFNTAPLTLTGVDVVSFVPGADQNRTFGTAALTLTAIDATVTQE